MGEAVREYCHSCEGDIAGEIQRDENNLPFCEPCYEDLCAAMFKIPKSEGGWGQ